MPRKPRMKSTSGIYHIMLRGANRQEIFHDDHDCMKFLDTIKKYKVRTGVSVYGWCLMNNHVHLLLKEGDEDISTTMKRIGVSYVSYYNWKYYTTGHLFQDRYRSENVENDRYLMTVVRYIHQNPVKAGMVKRLDEWRWSSFLGYFGESIYPNHLLDEEFVLRRFSDARITAEKRFKEYNEAQNKDKCLDDVNEKSLRLTDEEAREKIKHLLGEIGKVEIAQVKSLPRSERNQVLQAVKGIDRISQRQAARILGVSPNLLFKA